MKKKKKKLVGGERGLICGYREREVVEEGDEVAECICRGPLWCRKIMCL